MSGVQIVGFAAISSLSGEFDATSFVHGPCALPEMQESVLLMALAENRKCKLRGIDSPLFPAYRLRIAVGPRSPLCIRAH
jgi:hypothetical protein